MNLLYFAWVRERIGKDQERVSPPDAVKTISDLGDWLCTRGENYVHALGDRKKIRVALNQVFVSWNQEIFKDDEVAFFPPVTGG